MREYFTIKHVILGYHVEIYRQIYVLSLLSYDKQYS